MSSLRKKALIRLLLCAVMLIVTIVFSVLLLTGTFDGAVTGADPAPRHRPARLPPTPTPRLTPTPRPTRMPRPTPTPQLTPTPRRSRPPSPPPSRRRSRPRSRRPPTLKA